MLVREHFLHGKAGVALLTIIFVAAGALHTVAVAAQCYRHGLLHELVAETAFEEDVQRFDHARKLVDRVVHDQLSFLHGLLLNHQRLNVQLRNYGFQLADGQGLGAPLHLLLEQLVVQLLVFFTQHHHLLLLVLLLGLSLHQHVVVALAALLQLLVLLRKLIQVQHANLERVVLSLHRRHALAGFLQSLLEVSLELQQLLVGVFQDAHLLVLVGEYGLEAGLVGG